jgi:hypothetical protein
MPKHVTSQRFVVKFSDIQIWYAKCAEMLRVWRYITDWHELIWQVKNALYWVLKDWFRRQNCARQEDSDWVYTTLVYLCFGRSCCLHLQEIRRDLSIHYSGSIESKLCEVGNYTFTPFSFTPMMRQHFPFKRSCRYTYVPYQIVQSHGKVFWNRWGTALTVSTDFKRKTNHLLPTL